MPAGAAGFCAARAAGMERTWLLRAAALASIPRRCLSTMSAVAAPRGPHPPDSTTPRPWLFVGLGNPGEKYQSTRHNVGFDMIDAFAQSEGIYMGSVHCKAIFGHGLVGGVPVLLAKPQTYMNLSGESAGPLAAYYKLPLDRVALIFDDMCLPCGVLRLQRGGGHGGHNGLKNAIRHFRGNKEFVRLRIGIGRPPGQMDPKAFVLQKFNATARHQIETALYEGVGMLKTLIAKGMTECARSANAEQKFKHLRLQTTPSFETAL